MAKVGIFTWQPELTNPSGKSSAGGSSWTRYLIDELVGAGHKVLWLLPESPRGTQQASPEECDVAIICWRWEMPAYPERHELYTVQWDHINALVGGGKRVIVHDEDHKITDADRTRLIEAGAVLTAPEQNPRDGFRTLHFPNPFSRPLSVKNKFPFMTPTHMVYVGNVYERYRQAQIFFEPFARKFTLDVFGNWLESGADRPGEERVRGDMPHVNFKGRLPARAVVENLAIATATVHLFKPSYGPSGFTTLRWAEAAAAATVGFLPSNFVSSSPWASIYEDVGILVRNGKQMTRAYANMSEVQWKRAVEAQRDFVAQNMRIEPWIDLIEEVLS